MNEVHEKFTMKEINRDRERGERKKVGKEEWIDGKGEIDKWTARKKERYR